MLLFNQMLKLTSFSLKISNLKQFKKDFEKWSNVFGEVDFSNLIATMWSVLMFLPNCFCIIRRSFHFLWDARKRLKSFCQINLECFEVGFLNRFTASLFFCLIVKRRKGLLGKSSIYCL